MYTMQLVSFNGTRTSLILPKSKHFNLRFLIELSLPIDILSCGFLCCDVMLLFQKKGELLFGWRVVSLALTPHLPLSVKRKKNIYKLTLMEDKSINSIVDSSLSTTIVSLFSSNSSANVRCKQKFKTSYNASLMLSCVM